MRQRRRHIRTLAMVMIVTCVTRTVHGEELLLALRLNGQMISDGEVVTVDGDNVELSPALAHHMRLRIPPGLLALTPATIPLNELPGVKTKIDHQALVVDIDATPEAFEPTVIQNYVPTRPADPAGKPGLFMNYNLLTQTTGGANLSSGLFGLGSFSDYGVAMSDMVVTSEQGPLRLRNYLTQDSPSGNGSRVFGDSFLTTGAIGEAFPFGGIQVSSRASSNTDPRQTPVETILGQAALPSTVDVFVNNALQSRQSVPTGPFVLENIPVATGDGDIRVVVHDALGQDRVLVKSFYSNPQLMPEGYSEYAYEGGMMRRNYGAASFDYAEPFVSGTHRYGWTKWLTTEFHGEASTERQVVGEQTSFPIASLGTMHIGGGASDRNGAPGIRGLLGMDTDTHPFSAGFSSDIESRHFTQLGYTDDRDLQQSTQARIGYDMNQYGSLSASFIHLDLIGQPISNTVAVSYNLSLSRYGFFGVSAFSTLGQNSTGVIASLSIPLGETAILSSQLTHDQNGWGQSAQAIQNAPNDGGFGYRGLVDHSATTQRAEAGITYRSNYNEITADAGTQNNLPIARFGAVGSIGFFDGETFASRETDGNFAVVDTNGVQGIHVLADQQPVGVTDGDGKLVIPHLRAHEVNRIAIDPADIPLDVAVQQPEKEIVPMAQTGYIVNFDLTRDHAATASLVLDDGTFVPAGSPVQNAKTGNTFIVGNDGIIYLTGLTGRDQFNVGLVNGSCHINVALPSLQDIQPDLGKIGCHA